MNGFRWDLWRRQDLLSKRTPNPVFSHGLAQLRGATQPHDRLNVVLRDATIAISIRNAKHKHGPGITHIGARERVL